MRGFFSLKMNSERKSQISDEELEDDESDFFNPEDNWDEEDYEDDLDDEVYEREYCD